MRHISISIVFISLFFWSFRVYSQENDWLLKKENEDITVYTRSVENTNIKEFKASTTLSSSSETIFKIILDVENYPKWIEDVEYAEKIYHRDSQIGMYYQLKLPWPINDRDITLISKYEKLEDNSTHFKLRYNSELKAVNKDFIRITKIDGEWLIKPIDQESCEVTYRFLADPEGFLPAWVINLFIVDGPFKTMQNLEEYAKSWSDDK
jgi:ribosome-associated toxin RatA of RatAB toxin-antitoxin module